ncbi:MAG: hypothetical protein O2968_00340 [Acidobacteria bacterium]|nr:hypothetical protein [Acidobacteriota bacterium]
MKIVVIILLLCIGACGAVGFGIYYFGKQAVESVASEVEQTTGEGGNMDNPLGALSALGGMANDLQGMQETLENMEAVEPLAFQTIIDEVLPEPPPTWTAKDPRGSSQSMGDFKYTQASREYASADGAKTVTVTVADWAFNRAIYMPFLLAANFSQETTEGYNKGIKVGEDPGREEFTYASNRGKRSVLYGKRFNVEIDGRGIEPTDLEEWYGLVRKSNLPTP